jgi:bacterial/archaeal transporter family protein
MGWPLLAVISAVAAGATSVFAKAGLADVPSHLGNAIRTALVLGLSLLVLWWSGEHKQTTALTPRAWMFLALSGLATTVSWVAFFKALSLGPATAVTAIDKSSLAVTLVLGLWLLNDKITWQSGLGVALMVGGALLTARSP